MNATSPQTAAADLDPRELRSARLLISTADAVELLLRGLTVETDADLGQAGQCMIAAACELRAAAGRMEVRRHA